MLPIDLEYCNDTSRHGCRKGVIEVKRGGHLCMQCMQDDGGSLMVCSRVGDWSGQDGVRGCEEDLVKEMTKLAKLANGEGEDDACVIETVDA